MSQAFALHYEPRLLEEAVFLALREKPGLKEFRQQHDRLYEPMDVEERERLFGALHKSWFTRLELGKAFEQALSEQPSIGSNVEACFVLCAAQAKQEGAELFVAPAEGSAESARRTLRLLLRPQSLLCSEPLLTFLRRELFHIADMLDPRFAYEPTLPKAEGGPTYDTLITNRYRVLWEVTIAGRMLRRGWTSETVRDQQLAEFHRAFPMLEERNEDWFDRFFHRPEHRHPELAAFAFDPRAAAGSPRSPAAPGTHCPLCRFPTHVFEPDPARLGDSILATIGRDFPEWSLALGLCTQCADIYRANQLSLAAAKLLPGWTPCPMPKPTNDGHEGNRGAGER